ncbi:hypothetical protein LINPERHAP2_LOCUS26920 [Linum perenne]
MGPHSQMSEAHLCGIPRSCTYGVKRDSWRAHPNWTPAAIEATAAIFFSGPVGGRATDNVGDEAITVPI